MDKLAWNRRMRTGSLLFVVLYTLEGSLFVGLVATFQNYVKSFSVYEHPTFAETLIAFVVVVALLTSGALLYHAEVCAVTGADYREMTSMSSSKQQQRSRYRQTRRRSRHRGGGYHKINGAVAGDNKRVQYDDTDVDEEEEEEEEELDYEDDYLYGYESAGGDNDSASQFTGASPPPPPPPPPPLPSQSSKPKRRSSLTTINLDGGPPAPPAGGPPVYAKASRRVRRPHPNPSIPVPVPPDPPISSSPTTSATIPPPPPLSIPPSITADASPTPPPPLPPPPKPAKSLNIKRKSRVDADGKVMVVAKRGTSRPTSINNETTGNPGSKPKRSGNIMAEMMKHPKFGSDAKEVVVVEQEMAEDGFFDASLSCSDSGDDDSDTEIVEKGTLSKLLGGGGGTKKRRHVRWSEGSGKKVAPLNADHFAYMSRDADVLVIIVDDKTYACRRAATLGQVFADDDQYVQLTTAERKTIDIDPLMLVAEARVNRVLSFGNGNKYQLTYARRILDHAKRVELRRWAKRQLDEAGSDAIVGVFDSVMQSPRRVSHFEREMKKIGLGPQAAAFERRVARTDGDRQETE